MWYATTSGLSHNKIKIIQMNGFCFFLRVLPNLFTLIIECSHIFTFTILHLSINGIVSYSQLKLSFFIFVLLCRCMYQLCQAYIYFLFCGHLNPHRHLRLGALPYRVMMIIFITFATSSKCKVDIIVVRYVWLMSK